MKKGDLVKTKLGRTGLVVKKMDAHYAWCEEDGCSAGRFLKAALVPDESRKGKEYLDVECSETDETRRERFQDLVNRIRTECAFVEEALAANDTKDVAQHFDEICGWSKAALDELADAEDVG